MSPTTAPETELTPEFLDHLRRLSPGAQAQLRELLGDPMPNSDADWEYWKAEIMRRIEDVESGRVKALTHEEAMASIRKAREEREGRTP